LKTLIIDNYDSFTYNLYQLIGSLGGNPVVHKNDQITIKRIEQQSPTHIVISPGPGTVKNPDDFGICEEAIQNFAGKIPLLGVCLGHQGIIKAFGGKIETAPKIIHGKQSLIHHNASTLFKNVPSPFPAMRYHSLCGSRHELPAELKITAISEEDDVIMAIEHCQFKLFGIQFHPESFMTDAGRQITLNFLSQCG